MDQELHRKKLPDLRHAYTHKGTITLPNGEQDFYVTAAFFDDEPEHLDRLGEVFVKVSKYGSDVAVFVDGWAIMVSLALQYGVPWAKISGKFSNYQYPNILQAVTQAIDRIIVERRRDIGLVDGKLSDETPAA